MVPFLDIEGAKIATDWAQVLSDPDTAFLPSELKRLAVRSNRRRNVIFGSKESLYMEGEGRHSVQVVPRPERYGLTVAYFAWGFGDDKDHFRYFKENELNSEIHDRCPIAVASAEAFSLELRRESGSEFNPTVFEDEVEQWTVETLDADSILTIEFPRLLQFLPPEKLYRVLFAIGRKLYTRPWRKIVGIHPFHDNNLNVKWGKSWDHSRDAIMTPLIAGSGKNLVMVREAIIPYYHQKYTGFAIEERL